MSFDLSRLRRGERVAGAGALVLFLLLFLHWYTVSVSATIAGHHESHDLGGVSAWSAFSYTDLWLLLTILAAGVLVFLTATQRTPALPVTASVITTAIAAIGTLLALFRVFDAPGPGGTRSVDGVSATIDVSPTLFAFLGLVAVAAIAYGGYLSMREEGAPVGAAPPSSTAPSV